MSPYIYPPDEQIRSADGSSPLRSQAPPILASIGTVLIDAFDSRPRPIADGNTTPTSTPASRASSSASTPSTKSTNLLASSSHLRPTSPIGSSPHTPQMTFGDDDPTSNGGKSYEMLGGGALYALVGARFWLPPNSLRTLVDRAPSKEMDDLPIGVESELAKLGKEIWIWNRGEGTRMTRARIRYEGDVRFFQQIVKAPFRTMSQIATSPLYNAKYLHISPPYSPEDVAGLQAELQTLNERSDAPEWRPKIVFEPTPPSCHPGQKQWLEKILPGIEVLSPNHEELFSFYAIPIMEITDPELRPTVERLINHILHNVGIGKDGNGIVVVRCGRLGACVGTKVGGLRWCPAYFDGEEVDRVKDVTGAGNSFLGGYVAGLSISNDPYEALLYATVSASFVVEQYGLPLLTFEEVKSDYKDNNVDRELWNDEIPSNRLKVLRNRVSQ
ncbi:hypothetical protein IAR55_004630 [Kwoniella newhampshirensis]|uniref:Carbohydrate kinase PfkB domain-containing protein n=1 Tax=Kwoniella newhampshirensis TaxID=1651941 RepID=A0AAW0YVN2_9TREE